LRTLDGVDGACGLRMDAQVVLITGASRGFGAAAARSIASRGHLRDRVRLPDEDWERLTRDQGWGLAAGDVDGDTDGVVRSDGPAGTG
jgi:NAD(P)-dependent dehydrogenase (short-subunit alcohol dehydrogenase family)